MPSSICVIGNLNIDLIIRQVPHLPAWGQEVLGTSHMQVSSGQAGYLSFALSRLGIPPSLIGNVGEDMLGRQILTDLESYGVDLRGVWVTPGGQTGITVAIVREDGERAFVSNLGCLTDFSEQTVLPHWSLVRDAAIVCLVGIFVLPGLTYQSIFRLLSDARQAGKMTMLDTGWDSAGWTAETQAGMRIILKQVKLFIPNLDEARAITGKEKVGDAAAALQDLGPELVVIKCGAQGSYARWGESIQQVPALPVSVFDAVGAGDVFNSGFLYALLQKWPLEDCLKFGNSASSVYISRQADRFPHLDEVMKVFREYPR
jgi:ribokinase